MVIAPKYNLNNPYSFQKYKELVSLLAESAKTTGEQKQERIDATKINSQRINRIYKTYTPSQQIAELLRNISTRQLWIVLAESWCGDAAQNVPIIAKLSELNSNISLQIILRDENQEIMNMHLTNGTKSIPKLIIINPSDNNIVAEWGPRPTNILKMVKEYKAANPNVTHEEFVKNLHLWYAQDKGNSLEKDIISILQKISNE